MPMHKHRKRFQGSLSSDVLLLGGSHGHSEPNPCCSLVFVYLTACILVPQMSAPRTRTHLPGTKAAGEGAHAALSQGSQPPAGVVHPFSILLSPSPHPLCFSETCGASRFSLHPSGAACPAGRLLFPVQIRQTWLALIIAAMIRRLFLSPFAAVERMASCHFPPAALVRPRFQCPGISPHGYFYGILVSAGIKMHLCTRSRDGMG